jgi:hypothetical protein
VTQRGNEREGSLRRIPICGLALLFIAERRRQTHRWIRDFGSSSCTTGDWRNHLAAGTSPAEAIRASAHTGRPLGTPEFIQRLERDSGRALVAQKGGRPHKAASDSRQSTLNFNVPSVSGFRVFDQSKIKLFASSMSCCAITLSIATREASAVLPLSGWLASR